MQVFVFTTEAQAEEFCTLGYPKIGKDLKGNEVQDIGITLRAADWKKHPDKDEWYVTYHKLFEGRDGEQIEIDMQKIFPVKTSIGGE